MAAFDLEQYLAQGVRHILTGLTAAAGKNIKTAAFLARFAGRSWQRPGSTSRPFSSPASQSSAICTAAAATPEQAVSAVTAAQTTC